MKIILSGVTGLIGRELVRALLPDHQLVVISRNRKKAIELLPYQQITHVEWGEPIDMLAGYFKGCNAVINLAGAGIADKPWSDARRQELISSRIDPVYHLACLLASSGEKPEVVIQASASGFYGQSPEAAFTEENAKGNGFLAEITEIWEGAATEYSRSTGRVVILRTGIVLSASGGALPQMLKPFRFMAGGPMGSGRQWVSWIHIEDVVRAIIFLLQQPDANGPYNLTAPEPVRQSYLAHAIGKALGKPSWLPAPAFALKLVLGKSMANELLLEGARILPQKLEQEGFRFVYTNVNDALNNILR